VWESYYSVFTPWGKWPLALLTKDNLVIFSWNVTHQGMILRCAKNDFLEHLFMGFMKFCLWVWSIFYSWWISLLITTSIFELYNSPKKLSYTTMPYKDSFDIFIWALLYLSIILYFSTTFLKPWIYYWHYLLL
jgi:hypothetical protein